MDLLADALKVLRPVASLACIVELGAPWGASAPQVDRVVFQYVQEGRCHLSSSDGAPLATLERGDLALWPHGTAHELRNEPGVATRPMSDILDVSERFGDASRIGDGRDTTLLCGTFELDLRAASPLRESLPPLIVVRSSDATSETSLGRVVRVLVDECSRRPAGYAAVIPRLTEVLLMHVLRHYASSAPARSAGFFAALADPSIGRALQAMHTGPSRAWTVATLAGRAGMSRSAFAPRFRELVGTPPLEYLTHWRIQIAAARLAEESTPVDAILSELGYASSSAFHVAFRKRMGVSPGAFRRRSRT